MANEHRYYYLYQLLSANFMLILIDLLVYGSSFEKKKRSENVCFGFEVSEAFNFIL